jgi:four helix bundle protein
MKRREEQDKPYRTFEDLEVYQIAREFRKAMCRLARKLPDIEKFGLSPQIRDAAVSLTNNVAEGHGRFHFLDQIKFMLNSRGSLEDLNVCLDENYLSADEVETLKSDGWHVHKLINGYIRFVRGRIDEGSSRVQELAADQLFAEAELNEVLFRRFNPSSL